jgi:hypothetical protein
VPSNQEVRDPEAADFRPEGGRVVVETHIQLLHIRMSDHQRSRSVGDRAGQGSASWRDLRAA